MTKICIISYYGLVESLKSAADALTKCGHEIYDFPLFRFAYDRYDKVDNYVELMTKYIQDNNVEVVLWWFINIDTDKFAKIKADTNVKYIFFNWDEPFNWRLYDLENKSKYFDKVFVICRSFLNRYLENGTQEAHYLLPAFDTSIHHCPKQLDDNHACDISFCCTNLYATDEYTNQYINRKQLVDDIYNGQFTHGYTFHIYGPQFLKDIYPKSYRGMAPYHVTKYIFHGSKINLCTHVLCDEDGYINERTILIGACKGLLLVDPVKGFESIFNKDEVIFIDKTNYIDQIRHILDNYQDYYGKREKLYKKCLENYTYDHWAKYISDNLPR